MEKKIVLVPGAKMSIETTEEGAVIAIYEPGSKPEFKNGDILFQSDSTYTWLTILKKITERASNSLDSYATYGIDDEELRMNNTSRMVEDNGVIRFATEEEKQLLFDALEKTGKRWNPEKKCFEELRWKPMLGSHYYFISDSPSVSKTTWNNDGTDNMRYNSYNCFRTEQDADEALPYIKEAFKNWNKK